MIGLAAAACAMLCAARLAGAGDTVDPLRAARQLAQGIVPLGESGSGITRDIGQIAVIEHDGSDYDRENVAARPPVAQRFYETHGDNYDFLVVFTNFEFETGEALAFHNLVRNSVRGIGLPQVDNGGFFGAPGRLLGYIDMAAIARYLREPQSLTPGSPGFTTTLNVLAHEIGHQWLARVRYRDATGTDSTALLGRDGSHWSYLLDSDASLMYGSDWTAESDGGFVATRVDSSYSALDLYLMGFLDPTKVTPFVLLRNPAVDATQPPREGDRVLAEGESVTLAQVIAVEGERSPSFLESPKVFRVGFVLLTSPGVEPDPADLEAVEQVRRAFPAHFFALTRGIAITDTTLAEASPLTPAPFPDLDRALAWLLERQGIDGRFEDSALTAIRDTATAMDALLAAGVTGVPRQRAAEFLNLAAPASVDALARRSGALSALSNAEARREAAQRLLSIQNADGGFGPAQGFLSDALDTALALRALKALDWPSDSAVRGAVSALAALASPGGGWPAVPGGPLSTVVTSEALLGLLDWKDLPEAAAPLASGVAALIARQNRDGGFGESPSTPYATALSLQALVRVGASQPVVDPAIAWLQREQQSDGSWRGGRYPTALVLDALKGGVSPNLVVPAESIAFTPATVQEGTPVQATARIANTGRTPAGPSRVRLYDGPPGAGDLLGEAEVPALGAGESAATAFHVATEDRAGSRALYVVADAAGEVPEGREDDNASTRTLQVTGLLPDLAILPGDLVATPAPAEEGETVTVSVRVTNLGTKRATSTLLRVFDGDPSTGGRLLGEVAVSPLDTGAAFPVVVPWATEGSLGDHTLFAAADAGYAAHESDETNNQAWVSVPVTGPLPPGPDLELESLTVTPSTLSSVPQDLVLTAVVRNLGRDPAASTVLFENESDEGMAPVATRAVDVAPRSSQTLSVPVTIDRAGSRAFLATADPGEALDEVRENNNQAGAYLNDPGNSLDVELPPSDLQLSSSDLEAGETLEVTLRVRNRGTVPLSEMPVILVLGSGEESSELARTVVSLAPGQSTSASLAWRAAVTGDAVPLSVHADPFGALAERDEGNNLVAFAVRVRPSALADLVAGDVVFQPDPPLEGAPATILVKVSNPSVVAAGPFMVAAYTSDPAETTAAPVGIASLAGLDARAETTVAIPWPSVDVRGSVGLFLIVDPEGTVPEYDENNNSAFRPFGVLGLPDLVVTAADASLTPAYPRAGESVTLRVTVRNLGGQASSPTLLRALDADVAIGEQALEELAPGRAHVVNLAWTPAAAGAREVVITVDPDDVVREQSQGNNVARVSLLVQNADLYLTAPFFSPNGDGERDVTSLGYRATGSVTVVVSNSRGQLVRTLAADAPAEGSLEWDGRDETGRIVFDGPYTLSVQGAGGIALGRITAVVDTNRSPIHDAAGTGLVAEQLLTGQLPSVEDLRDLVWLPQEDEALVIIQNDGGGFVRGLVRVALDGSYSYVAKDPWYDRDAHFVGPGAVSPDGREALLYRYSRGSLEYYAVDLDSGARRALPAEGGWGSAWSPDGRLLKHGRQILDREGELVTELPEPEQYGYADWSWSPDSRSLAIANEIFTLGTNETRTIPIPPGLVDEYSPCGTTWRGDGKIYSVYGWLGEGCYFQQAVLIDPSTDAVVRHPFVVDPSRAQWSPDGSRLLFTDPETDRTVVAPDQGGMALPLARFYVDPSPRSSLASFSRWSQSQSQTDLYALLNLLNLTAEFQVSRLPGNNGVLVKGIVSDRNLERYQLEYASQSAPEVWRPIGAASEVPVLGKAFAVWAPPQPGTYLLRLTAWDKAGNRRSRVEVVAWDRTPVLADLTQDEFLISPNGDGVKEHVTFHYVVQEPTVVQVRIVGPGEEGATLHRFALEYPTIGAASFTWDGRDSAGAVAPDGSYTVFLNELPLRVEVDTTPPDVAWRHENLRAESQPGVVRGCGAGMLGELRVEALFHVVDAHLKEWESSAGVGDSLERYVPATDENGNVLLDGDRPRVLRVDGRVADLRETSGGSHVARLGQQVIAEDYAGNKTVVPIVPLAERLFLLEGNPGGRCEAMARGTARLLPPVAAEVYNFKPTTGFVLGAALRDYARPRLQIRLENASGWTELPPANLDSVDFPALGVPVGPEYEGRFAVGGESTDIYSEAFRFRLCDQYAELSVSGGEIPGSDRVQYELVVRHNLGAEATGASVYVKGAGRLGTYSQLVTLQPSDSETLRASFVGPATACACPDSESAKLFYVARVRGASGHAYEHNGVCLKLATGGPQCGVSLDITEDTPQSCGPPDRLPLLIQGDMGGVPGVPRVIVERGPDDPMMLLGESPLGTFLAPAEFLADVAGVPEGEVAIRATLRIEGNPNPQGCTMVEKRFFVDRTPPTAAILSPVEEASICVSADPKSGREIATLIVSATDRGLANLSSAEYRREDGPWMETALRCLGGKAVCEDYPRLRAGPVALGWDATGLEQGRYTVRLGFCDGAGNTTTLERSLLLRREPPYLRLRGSPQSVFSPNGDGRSDEVRADVELFESVLLSARVRAASSAGPVVREIFADQTIGTGARAIAWDGRDDQGQTVPDGHYVLVVSAANACGASTDLALPLAVDTTPPLALIVEPSASPVLEAALDVRGVASDERLSRYELSEGRGASPSEWRLLASRTTAVNAPPLPTDPFGVLGPWDTQQAGVYTLRLVATDIAGNSNEARVTLEVAPRRYLGRLAAVPALFSPNGDGRLETSRVEYELTAPAIVTLEVKERSGAVVRRFEADAPRGMGSYAFEWDGVTDAHTPAPDGNLALAIHLVDPEGIGDPENASFTITLDRAPPEVVIEAPPTGGYSSRDRALHGSITDPRMASFRIEAAGPQATRITLAEGTGERRNGELAPLAGLAEGPQTLFVTARDAAENEATAQVSFTLDSIAPVVALHGPSGALAKEDGPRPVNGTVEDVHLAEYELGFAAGETPTVFVDLAKGTQPGRAFDIAAWSVESLPDGPYTLRLRGFDLSGQSSEARLSVRVDGTAPLVRLDAPAEGEFLRQATEVVGLALDDTLASWRLEAAPGPPETAFQWSQVAEGTAEIEGELLGNWRPPVDGPYTLRLTARDEAGHVSTALRSVVVDTTSPPAPSGLRAQVVKVSDTTADVELSWDPGGEPVSYRVLEGGEELESGIEELGYVDEERGEGPLEYTVVAVDRAGNASAPTVLQVSIGLTPPRIAVTSPQDDDPVSGVVEVRGAAWSASDFKEYRLLVGAGTAPVTWTLLQRSTLPVSSGRLGSWTAVGAGPYVIALEAEDDARNVGRVTVPVIVDNDPPTAPVLSSVLAEGSPDSLRATWEASSSSDVLGYLLERNARLVNANGLVLGDRRGYVVSGPSYLDGSLPDGDQCYVVLAMDRAGNESGPSNQVCVSLDNRAPHALIVDPPSGWRFEHPIRVIASTPDTDVGSVQFQVKAREEADWSDLGAADAAPPFEVTFDPEGRSPGFYGLRAVAADRNGRTDANPASIEVLYKSRPAPPGGLVALAVGSDVSLSWTPSPGADVTGYLVARDGESLTPAPIARFDFADWSLSLGQHEYEVRAVDRHGVESLPQRAEVAVYQVRLEQPFPVTSETHAVLRGGGAQPGAYVRILRDGAEIAAVPSADGAFAVDVPLAPGANYLIAVGFDAAGNESVSSEWIVLISNEAPAALTGLVASLDGRDAALTWDEAGDVDRFGYVVDRDGAPLTHSSQQTAAAETASFGNQWRAADAFDGDTSTFWWPEAEPSSWWNDWWQVRFAEPVLVERVVMRFAEPRGPFSGYRLEALSDSGFLPVAVVEGNASHVVEHAFPAPFATDTIRFVPLAWEYETFPGLAEVEVYKLDAVPVATPTFRDPVPPDGPHTYGVATIDRYGAVGPVATVELSVPLEAPAAPTGLVATVEDHDVVLSWTASPEPDVARYVVLRDGLRIAETPAPQHRDRGLPNGAFSYTVIAADSAGLESEPSVPALAVIAGPLAPPEIFFPGVPGSRVSLSATATDVRGFADAGTLVALDVGDRYGGTALASSCPAPYAETQRLELPSEYWHATVSRDGARAVLSWWDEATYTSSLTWVDIRTNARSDVSHPGGASSWVQGAHLLSDDGQLAYLAATPARPNGELYLLDVPSSERRLIDGEAQWHLEQEFSRDGRQLAFASRYASETRISLYEVATRSTRIALVAPASNEIWGLRWSPEDSHLSFTEYDPQSGTTRLRLLDMETGVAVTLEPLASSDSDWAPEGHRVAYRRSDSELVVRDLETDTTTTLGSVSEWSWFRFDPTGARLAIGQSDWEGATTVVVQDLATAARETVATAPSWMVGEWTRNGSLALPLPGRLGFFLPCTRGLFEIRGIPLAPGENPLVTRALNPETGLVSPDSEAVVVNVTAEEYADLTVASLSVYPPLPLVSQLTQIGALVENVGQGSAPASEVKLRVLGPDGAEVLARKQTIDGLSAGETAFVAVTFAPAVAGRYTLVADVDPEGVIGEARDDNNSASRSLTVAEAGTVLATLTADRASYPARTAVAVEAELANAGLPFSGSARIEVVDTTGRGIAVVDTRAVSLEYGQTIGYAPTWNTATFYAGDYRLRTRVTDTSGSERAAAEWAFRIEADPAASARLVPDRPQVTLGAPAAFRARIENRSANTPWVGYSATLRVLVGGLPVFESAVPLPHLLPGAALETSLAWPLAAPTGSHLAELAVAAPDGSVRATAQAALTVVDAPADVTGRLTLSPSHVLAGDPVLARVQLANPSSTPVTGLEVRVQVASGATGTVLAEASASVDLPPYETRELELPLSSAALAHGAHPVFLRAGTRSLDRGTLLVHAPLGPPSVDAPADGAVVATTLPMLRVNNATSTPEATLTYEFQLFADAALQQQLPGVAGVPEGDSRTSWRVDTVLGEDRTYYWRARASDGFSSSAWTEVAHFTVDELNLPPSSPTVDSPLPSAVVATRKPTLAVRNGFDPELVHLLYEFRIARDPEMVSIVAQAGGIAESFGVTSWTVPVTLDEDAFYHWSARASDGVSSSAWTPAASFRVDSENAPPTSPLPASPVGGTVATTTPELVVGNAADPEGLALVYRFEIDRAASFDSPELQASPLVAEGDGTTTWTAPLALSDNTTYHWRASASDGVTSGSWGSASFFVNLANDPPSVPFPIAPSDGQVVSTPSPTLRIRNSVDLDGDALVYDFRVSDAAGEVVASASAVVETPVETAWTVDVSLGENEAYSWSARAADDFSQSDWSPTQSFRVNAVPDPPTAPLLVAPPDGSTLEERRPQLTVGNAASPEGLTLVYAFEVYREEPGGPVLVDSAAAVPEGAGTTSFVAQVDLADGPYSWRARAFDGQQWGAWMTSARFTVAVDVRPAPPTGLTATPGDARVELTWQPSPEPDVTGYRAYRTLAAGGPYDLAGETSAPSFLDIGLVNGVTVYYVVTALDAVLESDPSTEVAATPQPPGSVAAEVRLDLSSVDAECLFATCDRRHGGGPGRDEHPHVRFVVLSSWSDRDRRDDDHRDGDHCPSFLRATIELPAGYSPGSIEIESIRLSGSIPPYSYDRTLVDVDHDGLYERRVLFRFRDIAPLLADGVNRLSLTGRFAGGSFAGEGLLEVRPLELSVRLTPETLVRHAPGGDVRAHLEMAVGLRGEDVELASLRLQGELGVKRVINVSRDRVIVDFDRAALLALLPNGSKVRVSLTGRVSRVTFEAEDRLRVRQ